MGDFNIHTDNPQDRGTKALYDTFYNFDLTQHINEPTHNQGNTLELIISKDLNISNIVVTDITISDHFCISLEAPF